AYPRGMRQPRGAGLVGSVLDANAPRRVADVPADPRTWDPHTARRTGMRGWLGVPLADQGGAFGVLTVLSTEPDTFRPDDERRLRALAALAGAAGRPPG